MDQTSHDVLVAEVASLLETLTFLAGVGMAIGLVVWILYRGYILITDVMMGRYR